MSFCVREPGVEILHAQRLTAVIETKNVSNKGCGVPDRYKGDSFFAAAIVGCALALAAFVLRMAASIGKNGRLLSWDDLTMGVVLALAIPPTVFAHYCKNMPPL